jgi:hypothetical protein
VLGHGTTAVVDRHGTGGGTDHALERSGLGVAVHVDELGQGGGRQDAEDDDDDDQLDHREALRTQFHGFAPLKRDSG